MRPLSSRMALMALPVLLMLAACGMANEERTPSVTPRDSVVDSGSGSVWVSVEADGTWIIDLEFPGGADWATMDPSSGEGDRSDVRLRYDANPSTEDRSVTMVLRTAGGSEARSTVRQSGDRGEDVETGAYGSKTAPWGWLELPATSAGDGLTFYAHSNDGSSYESYSKNGTRNWSMYWDASEHLSLWIAYPLNKSLIGNGSRSDAWGFDPLVPVSQQPSLIGGSYGGGWSRGHQLPSADRLSYTQNTTTFYSTNMTPQQYNFNGKIWAALETKVRAYAALADTLYVVTGCLYKDSRQVSGTSSGFAVKIPTHYFKALLYRGSSSYATAGGFMAAGFLLPHDASIAMGNFLDYIMTIDSLEEQTGIDFFPNLQNLIGKENADKVESAEISKWWK